MSCIVFNQQEPFNKPHASLMQASYKPLARPHASLNELNEACSNVLCIRNMYTYIYTCYVFIWPQHSEARPTVSRYGFGEPCYVYMVAETV